MANPVTNEIVSGDLLRDALIPQFSDLGQPEIIKLIDEHLSPQIKYTYKDLERLHGEIAVKVGKQGLATAERVVKIWADFKDMLFPLSRDYTSGQPLAAAPASTRAAASAPPPPVRAFAASAAPVVARASSRISQNMPKDVFSELCFRQAGQRLDVRIRGMLVMPVLNALNSQPEILTPRNILDVFDTIKSNLDEWRPEKIAENNMFLANLEEAIIQSAPPAPRVPVHEPVRASSSSVRAASSLMSGKLFKESLIHHLERQFGQWKDSKSSKTVYATVREICGDGLIDPAHVLNDLDSQLKALSEAPKTRGSKWLDNASYQAASNALLSFRPFDDDDFKQTTPAASAARSPLPHPDWDAARIQAEWEECVRTWSQGGRQRASRLNGIIFAQTEAAIKNDDSIDLGLFQQMFRGTKRIHSALPIPQSAHRSQFSTEITVVNEDTLDAAFTMVQEGFKPLVLDMANKHDIGGEPGSANAQEESMCRRSSLYPALMKFAHSPNSRVYREDLNKGGIYVPHVQVFRRGPAQGYDFQRPFSCGVYACPAYDCNLKHRAPRGRDQFVGYDKPADEAEYIQGTREKMKGMLRTAFHEGHDSLVLGAFGCGAFENDPVLIADLFAQVLQEPEFQGVFKKISFAIIDQGSSTNHEIFSKALHSANPTASNSASSDSSCVIQ